MIFDLLLLIAAGFVGGILNTLAGGGSFITFPALMMVGVAPVSANATNTFASCAGYLSGAYGFRDELRGQRKQLLVIVATSIVGGAIGALLLIQAPQQLFQQAIPWLLLFATLLFVFGGQINTLVKSMATQHRYASLLGSLLLAAVLLVVCIYGGFFNAGLGIIALSYLALAGFTNINTMNGIKLVISSTVSLIAIVMFVYNDAIAWSEGSAVLIGTLFGGYMSAHVAKRVAADKMRRLVTLMSVAITAYFFVVTYC
ncbi:sulfite exporter TauE/SafE family protein [Ferrimonas lipolytica]|uniref:Probable membrane transporter protein n=1 Tax=Ferrimonas lipolytica TaxID=2724191 RepID=A0A6H1UBK1_9GAMM|nr:sulfite exporter TauE/SafE family protein [Ferrimonas lipolytica]QIZ76435.1 sulfite exporter TauE/SafE family protein [Ferrimonas lipolytica]